jgi:S-adenosylmethionine decarboxylase
VQDYTIKGRLYAVDIFDGDFAVLNDGAHLLWLIKQAALECGATIMKDENGDDVDGVVQFDPQGASGFVILTESHASFHSYPEKGFVAVDLYTCGSPDPKIAAAYIVNALNSKDYEIRFVPRGR